MNANNNMSRQTKRRVPKLRFPEFRDDPAWEVRRLGDIGSVSMCKRILKKQTSENGDIPFFKIGTFGKVPDAYISKDLYETHKEKYPFPNKGDILISASGTIGRTVVYDGEPAYFQDSNIVWIANDESAVLNSYLQHVYKVIKWQTADNTISRLYNDSLRRMKIVVPSQKEQQKIADCLASVDALIGLQGRKVEQLARHKQALLQQLFPADGETTPRLRFPEYRTAPPWEEKRLGEVFQERNERDGSNLPLLSVTQTEGVIKTSELSRKNNASSDLSNYKKVYSDDIVYNSMRMWQGASGVSAWDGIVSPAYTVIKPSNNQYPLFWAYYFKCSEIIEKFARFSQGVTSDTWNLKFPAFSKIKISVPALEEEQKIANCLSSLDTLIDLHRRKLAALKRHKQGLMQQLFSNDEL